MKAYLATTSQLTLHTTPKSIIKMSIDPPQTNGTTNGTTNGALSSTEYFQAIGAQVDQVAPVGSAESTDDDVKPVDEIESLCMNCHEDVSVNFFPNHSISC